MQPINNSNIMMASVFSSSSSSRGLFRLLVVLLSSRPLHALLRTVPHSDKGASVEAFEVGASTMDVSHADRFLLGSFPSLRQVAYCHLPDNVWRPLVLGDVVEPTGVAVDPQSARLFVADPGSKVIWWYKLRVRDGFLETYGERHAAVQNVTAQWLAVNGVGDLYFTGREKSKTTGAFGPTSIFRQDARHLATGNAFGTVEVYSRANTGSPDPKVWEPSGLAVDSLFVYWANSEGGSAHGSVVKGSRANIGLLPKEQRLEVLSKAVNQVHSLASTGTHIFYTSPKGVYGVLKSTSTPATNATFGLIAGPPAEGNVSAWNPAGIAWDGDNSLYFTETSTGAVYMVPSMNKKAKTLKKFVDAPGVVSLAHIAFATSGGHRLLAVSVWPLVAAMLVAGSSVVS